MSDGKYEYFDIHGKTAPLVVIGGAAWTGTTSEMRARARLALFSMRGKPYNNPDTGWAITLGRDAIDKALSEGGRPEHFQALEKLPELLRNAVLVRKSLDTKSRPDIKAFYRLYAPIVVNGKMYAAQITVKEGCGDERHFYVQRLQIEKPAGRKGVSELPYPAGYESAAMAGDGGSELLVRSPGPAGSPVSISQLLAEVKSEDAAPPPIARELICSKGNRNPCVESPSSPSAAK